MKISSGAIFKLRLIYLLCFLLAGGVLFLAGGCDDKEREVEIPEPSPDYSDKGVYVIFPVNALGDHAYNDLILEGILEAQKN